MASNEEREAPLEPSVDAVLQGLPAESRATLDANQLALIQQLAQRNEQLAQRAARESEGRAEERMLREGTYYATFDEVWNGIPHSYSLQDYSAMIRNGLPSYQDSVVKNQLLQFRFQVTKDKATSPDFVAAINAPTRATLRTSDKQDIWPVDVLQSKFRDRNNRKNFIIGRGVLDDNSDNEFPPSVITTADVAHLVPASPVGSALYHHVALWVFGDATLNHHPNVVQKIIHGSCPKANDVHATDVADKKVPAKKKAPRHVASRKVATKKGPVKNVSVKKGPAMFAKHPPPGGSVQSSKAISATRREAHTGLKHMICNKIKLAGQADFFDASPCVIIVPVLSLRQARKWRGEGYDAIFMISTGKKTELDSHEELASANSTGQGKRKAKALSDVASGVKMLAPGTEANKSEIDLAADILTHTVKGLAYALTEMSADTDDWVSNLLDESKKELCELRGKFMVITGEKRVFVPKERQGNLKPVRKITFAPAFGSDENDGHPAPDPLLLVVKAAVNWSWFHQQKLLAAGEVKDSYTSEQSIAEMDAFLEAKRSYDRARQDKVIINMEIIHQLQSACS